MSDLQSRKWLLTINNPQKYAVDDDFIKSTIDKFKNVIYYCFSQEIGAEGTHHYHIFIYFKTPRKFTVLKNSFPVAHLDSCKGSCKDNRDYIFKEGKHLNTEKESTNLKDTHFEFGECPIESQGQRSDLLELYDNIKSGLSDLELIEQNANNLMRLTQIDRVRLTLKAQQFSNVFRNVEVNYLFGEAGNGKTKFVFNKFGYDNVYRCSDYEHPFDTYNGEDVMLFDEFNSQIPITKLLMYIDGYPLSLPARYYNRPACFTKVFFCSNFAITELYSHCQQKQLNALYRRINHIFYVNSFGELEFLFNGGDLIV